MSWFCSVHGHRGFVCLSQDIHGAREKRRRAEKSAEGREEGDTPAKFMTVVEGGRYIDVRPEAGIYTLQP
jgi:hypothetical protein